MGLGSAEGLAEAEGLPLGTLEGTGESDGGSLGPLDGIGEADGRVDCSKLGKLLA